MTLTKAVASVTTVDNSSTNGVDEFVIFVESAAEAEGVKDIEGVLSATVRSLGGGLYKVTGDISPLYTLSEIEDLLETQVSLNAEIEIAIAVDDATPEAEGAVVYTVTVTNNGPHAAAGVAADIDIVTGLTFTSDDGAEAGTYVDSTGVWTIGALAVDGVATLNITCAVDAGTEEDVITMTATCTTTTTEVDSTDNADTAVITVEAA